MIIILYSKWVSITVVASNRTNLINNIKNSNKDQVRLILKMLLYKPLKII